MRERERKKLVREKEREREREREKERETPADPSHVNSARPQHPKTRNGENFHAPRKKIRTWAGERDEIACEVS